MSLYCLTVQFSCEARRNDARSASDCYLHDIRDSSAATAC
jgi:hypothetical protein